MTQNYHGPWANSMELINKKLIEHYGYGVVEFDKFSGFNLNIRLISTDAGINLPKFRVVWSTGLTETRYGEFEVWSDNGLVFLREEKCVEEVEKYAIWPDKYVLEMLCPVEGNPYMEKAGHKYSYEPRWVFGNARSNPEPIWRAVKLLCDTILAPKGIIKSPNDLIREEAEKIQKEKALFKTMLQDESPYLAGMLHNADGIKSSGVVVNGFRDKEK